MVPGVVPKCPADTRPRKKIRRDSTVPGSGIRGTDSTNDGWFVVVAAVVGAAAAFGRVFRPTLSGSIMATVAGAAGLAITGPRRRESRHGGLTSDGSVRLASSSRMSAKGQSGDFMEDRLWAC